MCLLGPETTSGSAFKDRKPKNLFSKWKYQNKDVNIQVTKYRLMNIIMLIHHMVHNQLISVDIDT